MKRFSILFEPDDRVLEVDEGTNLLQAVREAGIELDAPCGGKGTCGGCKVQVTRGKSAPTPIDVEHFSQEELDRGFRLACQLAVPDNLTCIIPAETRLSKHKILKTGTDRDVVFDPMVVKRYLRLEAPDLSDQRSDVDRLAEALGGPAGSFGIPLHALRQLPVILRESNFSVTATSFDGEWMCIEPGDTTTDCMGVAVDIGTTTVVGTLIELTSGRTLAVVGKTNPQVAYGDDVVSRIHYADSEKDGLQLLHNKIIACLNEIIGELTEQAGVKSTDVYEVVAVGNTTMSHLLLGVSPFAIAQAPYVSVYREGITTPAAETGLEINDFGRLTVLPNVAGFVGADTVAVILATNMHQSDRMTLAIDIGTNGEIVLGTEERLLVCSTAAGPAFEGARIKFGMRATTGAIDRVDIVDGKLRTGLVRGDKVAGICGTGLIDVVAELLEAGIIDETGRMLDASAAGVEPGDLERRIRSGESGCDFVLAWPDETTSGKEVYLTQKDVREVQLGKGAIFAGIQIIKNELGVTDDDIAEILLAGAFGNYIRPERAHRIGLFPCVDCKRVRSVGNAAASGARLALVNRGCRLEAVDISRRTEYVELAGRPDFQMEFAAAMMFPKS